MFYATNGACDGVLRKLIIVVDGFDPRDTMGIEKFYNENLNVKEFEKGNSFADSLRAQGYDVVVLNFPTYQNGTITFPFFGRNIVFPKMIDGGADYIERNALVLVALINRINALKQGTEKLTIISPSMGGLISRYALAYMKKKQFAPQNQTEGFFRFTT